MPRELEFKFMESGRQDLESVARTRDIDIKSGNLTINESRSRAGMPLVEAPEADMPIIVTGMGAYFVTNDGLKSFDDTSTYISDDGLQVDEIDAPSEDVQNAIENVQTEEETDTEKTVAELRQFLRFLKKSPERNFRFKNVPVVYAEVLNKFVVEKDYDSARWYAERYLA